MPKKSVKLAKNFYYNSSGSIEFRKMIRGELITGRTGITDPRKLNKLAPDIANRFINEHYQLKKPSKKQPQSRLLFKQFLISKQKQGCSHHTIRTYKTNIGKYLQDRIPITRERNGNKFVSKSYQNAIRRDYNIFARWCQREGYDIKLLKGNVKSESRMRVLSESEFESIISVIPNTNLADCYKFIYYTGARRKEVHAPKSEWLRQNNKGDYYLQVIKKGGSPRIIRINNQALDILKKREFVFWDFSMDWITRAFKKYSNEVGITDVQVHDIRRTFGYNLLVNGIDIAIIARLLGISMKVAEEHYTPLLPANVEDFTI